MQDLSPEEVARYQLDELIVNQRGQLERATANSQRWVLSLAVANGAALTASAAKLIESKSEFLAALLMPSCWCFFVGLIAAGLVTPITAKRHVLAWKIWKGYTVAFRKGEELILSVSHDKKERCLYRLESSLEIIAAAAFVIGLIIPLVSLCANYLSSGHGFFPPA